MRHYIYISLMAIASVFCFAKASGQALTRFGGIGTAGDANDTTWASTQLVLMAYANNNPNLFATFNSSGAMVLGAVSAGADSSIFVTLTRLNDSLYGVLRFSDSVTHYVTPSQLQQAIAGIIIPTWQQTVTQGRTADSVLVSDNLYIRTTSNKKPVLLTVIGDSRDQAVSGGPSFLRVWSYRLANYMGWTFDGSLAIPSTFFMNLTPRYNPLDDSSAVMDIIETNAIRNQSLMGDTTHYIIVTRCINDLFYYTKAGGTNYTPENFGASYRVFMDSLLAKGKDMNYVILMGPKYVSATSTQVTRDSVFRWRDTVRQVAADYGAKFFDAFSYEASRGGDQLLGVDNFHENVTGHSVLLAGMLDAIGYDIERNEQALAVNGLVELNDVVIRGGDTSTINSLAVLTNNLGKVFLSDNYLIRNNTFDSLTQEADINVHRIKARMFQSQGLNSVSFMWANGTAFRGSAATGGSIFIDASQDLSGTLTVRAGSNTTFSSTGLFNSVVIASPIFRATTAFQGSAASNGTLFVDASQNTTGTVNIRAGSTTTFTSAGVQMTALNVNNNLAISSAGVITEYKNAVPALNRIIIGNGTIYDTATVTPGTGISITNSSGRLTFSTDTTTVSSNLWFIDTTAITTTSSRTTTRAFNQFYVDATSGNVTLTFTSSARQTIHVTRRDATANIVTIQFTGKNVQGNPSFTGLTTSNQNAPFFDNGTNRIEIQ